MGTCRRNLCPSRRPRISRQSSLSGRVISPRSCRARSSIERQSRVADDTAQRVLSRPPTGPRGPPPPQGGRGCSSARSRATSPAEGGGIPLNAGMAVELRSGETAEGVRLAGRSLAGLGLRMTQLVRCRLTDCDLSNAEWTLCRLEEVRFERCRLTGFRLAECRGVDVAFHDCAGRYLQVHGCRLEEVRFERCQLGETTLMQSELVRAVFAECDLTGSVVARSRLRGADLRGCGISGIRATIDDLAGTVLDPEQAAALLLGEAGIRVLPLGLEDGAG